MTLTVMQFMIHQALFGVFESTLQWSCICKNGLLTRFKELFLSFLFTLFGKKCIPFQLFQKIISTQHATMRLLIFIIHIIHKLLNIKIIHPDISRHHDEIANQRKKKNEQQHEPDTHRLHISVPPPFSRKIHHCFVVAFVEVGFGR